LDFTSVHLQMAAKRGKEKEEEEEEEEEEELNSNALFITLEKYKGATTCEVEVADDIPHDSCEDWP